MSDKKCTKCEKFKPFGAFGKHKNRQDGLDNWCRECKKAHNKQPLQKLMSMYNKQREKSKQRGHKPPAYTIDELVEKYLNDSKYIKLHKAWVASNYDTKLAPSLDRKDNNIGYSFDNIELMTWQENDNNGDRDQKLGKLGTPIAHVGVSQYTKDGVLIQSFISLMEAERVIGVNHGDISRCLSGRYKSAGGFLWKKNKKG